MPQEIHRDNRIRARWWYDLIWAVVFPAAGWGLYCHFEKMEAKGGRYLMPTYIAGPYKLFGKIGLLVLGILLGVVCLRVGLLKLKALKSEDSTSKW